MDLKKNSNGDRSEIFRQCFTIFVLSKMLDPSFDKN